MMNKTFAVACLMACAMSAKVRMNSQSSDLAQLKHEGACFKKNGCTGTAIDGGELA